MIPCDARPRIVVKTSIALGSPHALNTPWSAPSTIPVRTPAVTLLIVARNITARRHAGKPQNPVQIALPGADNSLGFVSLRRNRRSRSMTVPPIRGYSPSAAVPMLGEALLEHFDRAPIGLFLLDGDRKIVRANEALAQLTGISTSILRESSLRRFLSSDAPLDFEDRIFEELGRSNQWHGELEMRTSIGDTSPMMVSITPVGAPGAGPVRYVATVIELGEQRWIEAESSRRAAELAAFASIAVATGSSADPNAMLNAVARSIVDRFEAAHSLVTLAGEASYLSGSIRLSPTMIPDATNPALLRTIETREQTAES